MPPQYQPLLNTSVVRLTPGTISRASKKSRLYSQTFCFEVNSTSSLQLGDLALVLERLDEPNNLKSQICTINNLDESSGCKSNSFSNLILQKGTFRKNLNLHGKYLIDSLPKISLLKLNSQYMGKAEISKVVQRSNFEPKQVLLSHFLLSSISSLHFKSCGLLCQENPRTLRDGPNNFAWKQEILSRYLGHQKSFGSASLCISVQLFSTSGPFLNQVCHRPGLTVVCEGERNENPCVKKHENLTSLKLLTSKKLAGLTSGRTTGGAAHQAFSYSRIGLVGPQRLECNFQSPELHLRCKVDGQLDEEVHMHANHLVGSFLYRRLVLPELYLFNDTLFSGGTVIL